jgi:hypothetical protein
MHVLTPISISNLSNQIPKPQKLYLDLSITWSTPWTTCITSTPPPCPLVIGKVEIRLCQNLGQKSCRPSLLALTFSSTPNHHQAPSLAEHLARTARRPSGTEPKPSPFPSPLGDRVKTGQHATEHPLSWGCTTETSCLSSMHCARSRGKAASAADLRVLALPWPPWPGHADPFPLLSCKLGRARLQRHRS